MCMFIKFWYNSAKLWTLRSSDLRTPLGSLSIVQFETNAERSFSKKSYFIAQSSVCIVYLYLFLIKKKKKKQKPRGRQYPISLLLSPNHPPRLELQTRENLTLDSCWEIHQNI